MTALRLGFLLSCFAAQAKAVEFTSTDLSSDKKAHLALPSTCAVLTNKNAAHGKLSYAREWPTASSAKECAKFANMCTVGESASVIGTEEKTPCSVWVWHDGSMGEWAYACILWSYVKARDYGRGDSRSWVQQVGVTSGVCFEKSGELGAASWRRSQRAQILNESMFNAADTTAILASQTLALPTKKAQSQAWTPSTKDNPQGRFRRKQTEMNALEWWLIANGAHFPKMKVHVVEGSEEGGAVVVTEAVPRGEVLAVIPYELMFSLRTVERELRKRFDIKTQLRLSGNYNVWRDYVALCLAANRKDAQNSFYTPYIRALPKHLPHIPAFYDKETRKLLEDTTLEKAVEEKEENYRMAWLRVRHQHDSIDKILTEEDFFWALGIVDSRSFSMSPPLNWEQAYSYQSPVNLRYGNTVAGSDPLSVEARQMQTSTPESRGLGNRINMCQSHGSALVPLADMLNHAAEPNVLWAFDPKTDAFILLAAKDMKAGQKAIDSYGNKGNKDFLSQYGFTLKDANVEVDLRLRSDVTHKLAVSLGHWKEEWCKPRPDLLSTKEMDSEHQDIGPAHLNQICSHRNVKLKGKLIDSLQIPSSHGIHADDAELVFCQQNCMWDPKCKYWTIRREVTYGFGSTTSHGHSQCKLYQSIDEVKRAHSQPDPDDQDTQSEVEDETDDENENGENDENNTEMLGGDYADYGFTSGARHCLWLRPHCSFVTDTKNKDRYNDWNIQPGHVNELFMAKMKFTAKQSVRDGTGPSSISSPFILKKLSVYPRALMPLLRSTAPPPMRCAGGHCTNRLRRHMVDEWALRLLHALCQYRISSYPSTIKEDQDLLFKEWAMQKRPHWPRVSALKIRMWEKQTLQAVADHALEGANFLSKIRSSMRASGMLVNEMFPSDDAPLMPWEMLLQLGNLVKPLNAGEIKINGEPIGSDIWLQVTGIKPTRGVFVLHMQNGADAMRHVKIELPRSKINWKTARRSDPFHSFSRITPPEFG